MCLYYFIMNCGGKETVQLIYWIKFVVNLTNKEWPFWGLLQCQQLSRMLNNCGKSTHVYLSLLGGSRICFLWVLKELFTLKHVFKWRYWFSTFKSCYFSYNRNCQTGNDSITLLLLKYNNLFVEREWLTRRILNCRPCWGRKKSLCDPLSMSWYRRFWRLFRKLCITAKYHFL